MTNIICRHFWSIYTSSTHFRYFFDKFLLATLMDTFSMSHPCEFGNKTSIWEKCTMIWRWDRRHGILKRRHRNLRTSVKWLFSQITDVFFRRHGKKFGGEDLNLQNCRWNVDIKFQRINSSTLKSWILKRRSTVDRGKKRR